jgi:glycosyltransferase involved in cell wall biosynthesis
LIVRKSAARARAVVTISAFTRDELIERLGVPAARIQVIPPGITTPSVRPRRPSAAPNLLFVGSVFNRRHVPALIRAFAPIARAHADASLDIAGDDRSYPREDIAGAIAAERLEGRVRWHRYVTDAQLQDLYANARAFAFLSEYEGLGLTPLEALAAQVPPVLLDTPVARESCGDAALYVGLGDDRAITAALDRALFSEPARAAILGAAPRVLARYQWSRAAADTLALLESALP